MEESEKEKLKGQLEALKIEHRDLDEVISRLEQQPAVNELQIRRLKKRKFRIKEMITLIENKLLSDIIA